VFGTKIFYLRRNSLMTNTKFRKRALLSSVAMLLVALVALGSATFAWFVNSPDANTTGFSMKTTTDSSLLLGADFDLELATTVTGRVGFARQVTLNNKYNTGDTEASSRTETLQPASMDAAGSLHAVQAQYTDNYGVAEGTAITNGAAYMEKVYFMQDEAGSSSTAKNVYLKSVTWTKPTIAAHDMSPAATVAILGMDGSLIETFTYSSRSQKFIPASMSTYAAANLGTRTTTARGTASTTTAVGTAKAYNTAVASLDYVTVVVYLDGEYSEVFSDNVKGDNLGNLLNNLNITFTLTAPTAP
jgi:hypothetical protein